MILDKIKNRGEEMAPLEGHDRLQYLIDIAREVPPLGDEDKIDENKITEILSSPYTRIPVWEESTDNFIGLLHIKSLIKEAIKSDNDLKNIKLFGKVSRERMYLEYKKANALYISLNKNKFLKFKICCMSNH